MKASDIILSILLTCYCFSCYSSSYHKGNDLSNDDNFSNDDKYADASDWRDGDILDDNWGDMPVIDNPVELSDVQDIQGDDAIDLLPDGRLCWSDADCYEGMFCEFPVGVCAPPGVCQGRGTGSCPISEEGVVCGCNNVTYRDDCTRRWAGVSKKNNYFCADGGECYQGAPWTVCGVEDEFCNAAMGNCENEEVRSFCEIKPRGECRPDWHPVCGCDGVTYNNLCWLQKAGVWRRHNGECR